MPSSVASTGGEEEIALLGPKQSELAAEGVSVRIEGTSQARQALLRTVEKSLPSGGGRAPRPHRSFLDWASAVGEETVDAGWIRRRALLACSARLSPALGGIFGSVPGGCDLPRWASTCRRAGLHAVPIAALMAFLIGVVLAFQGATQLRQFGAEVYVVDLIAIAVLRELRSLLTAIIVAVARPRPSPPHRPR